MSDINKTFSDLLAALEKCRAFCPWTGTQTVGSYSKQILGEAQEVQQAIEKNDMVNLKEELGDVLWDTLMVAHIAQDAGYFKIEDIMDNVIKKMKHRKPYVFESSHVSLEEAKRIWLEAKAMEKNVPIIPTR